MRKMCQLILTISNFSQSRAVEIHTDAQDLIAMLPKDALTKTMIRQSVDSLNAVSKSLEQLRREMRTLAAQLPEYPVVMAMRVCGRFPWPPTHGGDWGCDQVYTPGSHYRLCRC